MTGKKIAVVEASTTSTLILCVSPILFLIVCAIFFISGDPQSEGAFSKLFGDGVYLIFSGLILYAQYEFLQIFLKRKYFIEVYQDRICIFKHGNVLFSAIRNIYIEKGVFGGRVLIVKKNGDTIGIKSYLLKDSARELVTLINTVSKRELYFDER